MSRKNINYIITNSTPTGDYTPSTTETLEEAREWLLECTINNYISFRGPLLIGNKRYKSYQDIKGNKELIKEAKNIINNDINCSISDDSSYLEYGNSAYNRMTIFKV